MAALVAQRPQKQLFSNCLQMRCGNERQSKNQGWKLENREEEQSQGYKKSNKECGKLLAFSYYSCQYVADVAVVVAAK